MSLVPRYFYRGQHCKNVNLLGGRGYNKWSNITLEDGRLITLISNNFLFRQLFQVGQASKHQQAMTSKGFTQASKHKQAMTTKEFTQASKP